MPAVIILPNNSNVILAAQQAASLAKEQVSKWFLPARLCSVISALIAFQPDGEIDEMVAAMEEEIRRVNMRKLPRRSGIRQ